MRTKFTIKKFQTTKIYEFSQKIIIFEKVIYLLFFKIVFICSVVLIKICRKKNYQNVQRDLNINDGQKQMTLIT